MTAPERMTAPSTPTPSTPTPATLDAAAEAALADRARALYAWTDRIALLAEVDQLRTDAAAHADQLAQAHAAGTAEGATAERERVAQAIEARATEIQDYTVFSLVGSIWRDRAEMLRQAVAIARAGTSEADR